MEDMEGLVRRMNSKEFWKGKKVLLTGHTGFKGSWMCRMLLRADADVTGYALEAPTEPNLFTLCRLAEPMRSVIGDIRDLDHMKRVFSETRPEIVIHMAAQPIVRESYRNPVDTYETNVMGTVNVLECVRLTPSVRSVVNVTTDKVYRNREWMWGYRENEELNGFDPYSNSKSCSELVTDSYRNAFLNETGIAVSTCRAGNVIGGGDFATDRIIPDCVRAAVNGKEIVIRNPDSVRPYQYVLEAVSAYLMVARMQYEKLLCAGSFNIGPDENDCWTTEKVVREFCGQWNRNAYAAVSYQIRQESNAPHEASVLRLDCAKLKKQCGWKPRWDLAEAIQKTVEWYWCWAKQGDILSCMDRQIDEFRTQNE